MMDNISINISEEKGITLLSVRGIIDTNTVSEFEEKFLSALDEKKFKLVVDLKDVDYISSAGWGIFVSELKRIRGEKGDLVLAGMNPDVLDIFKLLQFDSILKYFPNVESAVENGFKPAPVSKK